METGVSNAFFILFPLLFCVFSLIIMHKCESVSAVTVLWAFWVYHIYHKYLYVPPPSTSNAQGRWETLLYAKMWCYLLLFLPKKHATQRFQAFLPQIIFGSLLPGLWCQAKHTHRTMFQSGETFYGHPRLWSENQFMAYGAISKHSTDVGWFAWCPIL